jgi:hypothetical protein
VLFSKAFAKAVVLARIKERQMRCRFTLAVMAAFVGGSSIAAHAQVVIPGAGVPGTGISNGPGAAGRGAGTGTGGGAAGQTGAGTGGIEGRGNFTGGILETTRRAGTGGIGDFGGRDAGTGGIKE